MNYDSIKSHLKSGGIIAYPTETVWGLGVDAMNPQAMESLYDLKGRDATKAVSILVANIFQARELAKIEGKTENLLNIFWPGPVTFVLPAKRGNGFVGMRCSSHPFVRELMRGLDFPITTTSANKSGEVPALQVEDLEWLPKSVLVIEDKNSRPLSGRGSTVVKIDDDKIECLREGDIDFSWIKNCMLG